MAATLVGGAFLSASVQLLLEKITSRDFQDFLSSRKLNRSFLDDLETTLLTLQVVLDDAEEKQISKPAVKEWIDRLKDAIFDAEDLLNTIDADSLRCKIEEKPQNKTNQVWNFLSSFTKFHRDINSKMEDLSRRLKQFARQKDILGLQSQTRRVSYRSLTSSSLVNESIMVGRDEDVEKLKNMLLSDDDDTNNNNIGVVTILGMGGLGKTTLAQLLFNNKEVCQHFDLKAWAYVSEDFNAIRVTKTLLQSVTSKAYDIDNFDFLQVQLKQSVMEKKFLFVLDDLWNEKYNDWDNLQAPFSSGKKGSKIIITTRQQRVAEITHTFPIHQLPPLRNEQCWSLLAKHAFGSEDISRYPSLEEIGRKIARKCGGLPIAAKTLGGVLRSKIDEEEWKRISNSSIWNLQNDDVIPALRLSYLHRPAHLKRCFAYCSIFPKDYLLDRKQLVLVWMAEGFVQQSQGEKTIEEMGNDYFDELVSRSLIQHFNYVWGDKFVMHDLVNDLAIIVAGRSCFRIEYGETPKNIRHLSFNREKYDNRKKFESIDELKCLRSFISLRYWQSSDCYFPRQALDDLLPTLKLLRVLSLSCYGNIAKLPDSIGNLVQLRYLNLSRTKLERLPDTIFTLYYLQTLILSECHQLIELPKDIGKLVNLRHLDISGDKLMVMPKQVCGLHSLQTLTCFVVGKQEDGLKLRELSKFPHLQGKLSILKLQNVKDWREAFDANLKGKEKIEELVLEWGKATEDSRIEKDVMDQLQPSTKLRELTINWYGGTSFPSWLGDSSFSNMIFLSISNCNYCISLPPLGLLSSLKELRVSGMQLESIGVEFYGEIGGFNSLFQPFPSLQTMEFKEMPNWTEWVPFESDDGKIPFPCLRFLNLIKCPKLRGHLPNHLPSLEGVEMVDCYELEVTPSTQHWITSIQDLNIENDSHWFEIEGRLGTSGSLASLREMILSTNCLQRLSLLCIPLLTCFPTDCIPTSLRSLHVGRCADLVFPPPEICLNYTALVRLSIGGSCDSLVSFCLDCFPVLEHLNFLNCKNLESLYVSEVATQRPSHLQSLRIQHCKRVRSLPEWIGTITTLRTLTINGLPVLDSFPHGGLPPNLTSFVALHCERLSMDIAEWGFRHLTSLRELKIGGDNIADAFLNEPSLLPHSLVTLEICFVSCMQSLEGNWLQRLTSLKELRFSHCKKLEYLPEDKLPPTLSLLSIWYCPVLKARYQFQSGEHWSKIAHIPVVEIDDQVII